MAVAQLVDRLLAKPKVYSSIMIHPIFLFFEHFLPTELHRVWAINNLKKRPTIKKEAKFFFVSDQQHIFVEASFLFCFAITVLFTTFSLIKTVGKLQDLNTDCGVEGEHAD